MIMNLNSNINCPDCSSQDVQKIVEQETKMKTGGNLLRNLAFGGSVLLIFSSLSLLGSLDEIAGLLAFIILLSGGIFLLRFGLKEKKKNKEEQIVENVYWVCRDCGREFR